MNTRTVEVGVGILVTLGVASLLMLALRVSGLSNFDQNNNVYKISAVFKNIGGLKIKSKVTIGGVRVGRVTNITLRLDGDEYVPVVEMAINKTVDKIPDDSSAGILTAGLLGDNYIGIELGQDKEMLKDGGVITLTSQALLLEDLISKFAVGSNSGNNSGNNAGNKSNNSTTKDTTNKDVTDKNGTDKDNTNKHDNSTHDNNNAHDDNGASDNVIEFKKNPIKKSM